MQCDSRSVGIVGLGNVGVTAAYALLLHKLVDELVLISRSPEKAQGEKLDLEHGAAFLEPVNIVATDDYSALKLCDIVIITAGAAQKPGQTRMDLLAQNKEILADIIPKVAEAAPSSTIIVISNPVDVLTFHAAQLSGFTKGRVFGSGTLLDTARFRFHLSEFLHVNSRSIHAYVLGEHGDTSFPVLSSATLGGQLLSELPGYSQEKALAAYEQTRQAAYQIIQAKGATYYAIGVAIAHLVKAVLYNQRSVMPVSTVIDGYYDQHDVALSVPCVIGRNGVEQQLHVPLSENEQAHFIHSCEVIKAAL